MNPQRIRVEQFHEFCERPAVVQRGKSIDPYRQDLSDLWEGIKSGMTLTAGLLFLVWLVLR